MPRFPQTEETTGSQKWLQTLVNDRATVLDHAIITAAGGAIQGPIRWLSPRRDDEYAEYSDQHFLDCLGISLPKRPLSAFWPARGPQWDALATSKNGVSILLEAKTHEAEVASDCASHGAIAQAQIHRSFREVQQHYGVDPASNWMNGHYQYANRIAHLYLLREINQVPTCLVFLYAVGDKEKGAASRASWDRVTKRIHRALGLPEKVHGVVDVFVEAKAAVPAKAARRR